MTNFPMNPKTGEIVIADLGYAAKTRPCLVLAEKPDSQRTIAIVAPLTTEVRGGETEVAFPKPRWLAQDCVVNLSGIGAIERHRIQRRLGPFPSDRFEQVKKVLAEMFRQEDTPGSD